MKTAWFESWFESSLYDLMYKHRSDDEASAFLTKLLAQLNPSKDDFFLDLACGTGRHSRFIHNQGYSVTGIDLSNRKISKAQQHSADNLEFFIQDMRKPFRINYFDFVLNLFTSFGYFDDINDNVRVIKSVKSGLKQNGVFVIDYLNSTYVKQHLVSKETKVFGEWKVDIERVIENKRLIKKMFWSNGEITRNYSEKVTLFSRKDVENMLSDNGFSIQHVYGDYDLKPFDELTSSRLIIVSTC